MDSNKCHSMGSQINSKINNNNSNKACLEDALDQLFTIRFQNIEIMVICCIKWAYLFCILYSYFYGKKSPHVFDSFNKRKKNNNFQARIHKK